jgi:hypothetical protein
MKENLIGVTLFLLAIGIAIVTASLLFKSKRELRASENASLAIAKGYEFKLSEKDSSIALQNQIIISKDSKLAKLGDSLTQVKKLKGQVRVITKTIIKTDSVYIDRVVKTDSGSYLRLPYKLSNESKWFGYTFTLDTNSYAVREALWFKSDILIAWGEEDHGNFIKNLLKTNKPIVYFKDQNPYSNTLQMQNAVYEDFKRSRLRFEAQVGYGITPKGLLPYAGVGLGISF